MYNILPQIYVDFWSRRGRDRITTDVVDSNLDQGEVYNIVW